MKFIFFLLLFSINLFSQEYKTEFYSKNESIETFSIANRKNRVTLKKNLQNDNINFYYSSKNFKIGNLYKSDIWNIGSSDDLSSSALLSDTPNYIQTTSTKNKMFIFNGFENNLSIYTNFNDDYNLTGSSYITNFSKKMFLGFLLDNYYIFNFNNNSSYYYKNGYSNANQFVKGSFLFRYIEDYHKISIYPFYSINNYGNLDVLGVFDYQFKNKSESVVFRLSASTIDYIIKPNQKTKSIFKTYFSSSKIYNKNLDLSLKINFNLNIPEKTFYYNLPFDLKTDFALSYFKKEHTINLYYYNKIIYNENNSQEMLNYFSVKHNYRKKISNNLSLITEIKSNIKFDDDKVEYNYILLSAGLFLNSNMINISIKIYDLHKVYYQLGCDLDLKIFRINFDVEMQKKIMEYIADYKIAVVL